jgi:hypothetical protein
MSLLTSVNQGAPGLEYFIENIGGAGIGVADAPCIKGTTLGAVRVGDPADGLILRGDTQGSANAIRGGQASLGSLAIGNSTASFQNIVLTDGITTVNGTLSVPAGGDIFVGDDVTLGGDLTFTNGLANGASISGYYSANTAPINCPDGVDTAVPAVAGLTPGWHIVSCSTAIGGQTEQQVSDMVFRNNAGLYTFGGSLRTPSGTGSFGFKVTADRTGLLLANSSGVAQNGVTVNFTKILNVV